MRYPCRRDRRSNKLRRALTGTESHPSRRAQSLVPFRQQSLAWAMEDRARAVRVGVDRTLVVVRLRELDTEK